MRLRYLHIPDLPPLKDVSITFGHEPVLGRECTIHFIVGVNGTGKSRLLRALTEVFLYLEQKDVPPFPVTIAYDRGKNLPGQEKSQSLSTIYYRYTGQGKASAYMVELDHIALHEDVDWENFHLFDWKKAELATLPYHKRRCLYDDTESNTYSEVKSYLPEIVMAYTSGSPHDWEMTFTPPRRDLEESLDLHFPNVESLPEDRRQTERPPKWSSHKEAEYEPQNQEDIPVAPIAPPQQLSGEEKQKQNEAPPSIGIFIEPQTLKLVVCAVALSQVLEEFEKRPTERDREAFEQEIDDALKNGQHMGGMRDIFNAVDWLWPVTIGLRIVFRPDRFLKSESKLLKKLYLIATKVIRDSEPNVSRTLFFDLQKTIQLPTHEEYHQKSTLSALTDILGGKSSDAYSIFKQLLLLQKQDILEDITMALKMRNIGGMILYNWLSDGESEFLGRMALFHLFRGIDNTLIILDEPETHFNDVWKREIVDVIDSGQRNDTSEIILSTHSSIALTDVFDTEITMLKKNPRDATVYATRPVIRSFGASPDDILRDIFGARDSVGQRATEFLDLMLIVIAKWEHVQEILAMHGTDDDIKRSKVFNQLKKYVKEQPGAYIALQTDADLADYLLRTLRAVSIYTQQHRSEVNMINMLDVLQERLGPGFYQFEFRRRLRALRKDSDAASD